MEIALLTILVLSLLFLITFNLIIFYKKSVIEITKDNFSSKKISIIISLKNEEKNVFSLMNSLTSLNYREEHFEVIFVDDNSTDATYTKLKEATEQIKNFNVIKATEKELPAKKGALTIGIANSKFDYIAITDGDCSPEEDWLINVSEVLDKYDIAFGAAPLIPNDTFVSRFASYEALRSQVVNLISLMLHIPVSATGRNFAFRKNAFYDLGGYESTMDKISGDDDLLIREALKHGKKIGFINPKGGKVFSGTVTSWKEFFKQKSRHVSTSHNYLFMQKLLLGVWFISNLLIFYSAFLFPLNMFFLFPLLLKLRIDISIAKQYALFSQHKFSIVEVIIFEFLYNLIVPINFINSFFYNDKWK